MPAQGTQSRRTILRGVLAAAGLGVVGGMRRLAVAENVPLTPECHDGEPLTLASVPGPYFEPHSPERSDFIAADSLGHILALDGRVLSRSCRPVARVMIDLWHADQNGVYDENGFRYRGHVFTDVDGRYRFRTIEPAVYATRTRHLHVKVQAPGRRVLTTQLFFPGEPRNDIDDLFRPSLLMRVADSPAVMRARFDFVIDV